MCRSSRKRTLWPAPWSLVAGAVLAVLIALTSYALLAYALSRDPGVDVSAYWGAAERLKMGGTLYAPGAANASDLYRYAPWFAAAWIPFTYLPRDAVTAGWVAVMVAASLLSTLPLLRHGPAGWAAFALFTPLQLVGAVFGNVQPLLVLLLMWGVERRAGPLWIALAASLKIVPVLLAVVYLGRGEMRRAALTLGLTALLWAPALAFDLSGYSTDPGPNQTSLAGVSLLVFVPVVLLAVAGTLAAARSRYAWLTGGLAVVASLPRLLQYEIGFVLVGLNRRR